MKLKSFSYFNCLLIICFYFAPVKSEDKIDIWNNKNKKQTEKKEQIKKIKNSQKLNLESIQSIDLNQNIKIEDGSIEENTKQNKKVFGIYDPAENDFDLNMRT